MFSSISWTEYLGIVVILLVVYYLAIVVKFHSFELRSILQGKRKIPALFETHNSADSVQHMSDLFQHNESQIFPIIQSLADEIEAFFLQASQQSCTKYDILESLRGVIAKYPMIRKSPYYEYINRKIEKNIKRKCSITINGDDLKGVWEESDGASF
jgi:hypothetical protein